MRWLVWRQHRWEGTSALGILAVVGGVMVATAFLSANLLAEMSRACASQSTDCGALQTEYESVFGSWDTYLRLVGIGVPALIGIFVGAPLVAHEFERGTHLLVWAQGITRRRWFVATVLWIGAATLLGTGVLCAAYQVWLAQHQSALSTPWSSFDLEPPVLIAYSLFALMLGTAFGALIQRTIAAMAATLVVFVAVRAAVEQLLRPMYLPPLTLVLGKTTDSGSSDWFLGFQMHVDLAGRSISDSQFNDALQACSTLTGVSYDCLLSKGVLFVQNYQPGSRFWLFQGIEAAIFAALALVFAAVAYWLTVRKT